MGSGFSGCLVPRWNGSAPCRDTRGSHPTPTLNRPTARPLKERIDYFCSDSLRQDLKGRTVRGGIATGLAQGIKLLVSLGSLPALARLLDPEDFGLVAIVTVFTGFASMFVDAGLSTATVQRGEINHRQVSNLFWIATALGVAIAAVTSVSAPLISWLYGDPRLIPITIAMASSFVLSGLTVQHQALMRRGMRFRELAVADVVSQLLAQVSGVAWAWWHYQGPLDYWALVLIPVVASLVRMVITCAMCGWTPGWPSPGAGTRDMVVFGADLTGGQFVNYLARNADKGMIGWYWGDAALGYYANAYRLLLFPLTAINGPLSNVAIPALSRLKDQPEAYRSFFRRGVELASMLMLPAVVSLVALAEPLILTVLTDEWLPSLPLFRALGPAAILSATAPATVWVYLSWGHSKVWLKWVLINTACTVVGFAVTLPLGVFWMAVGYSVVQCALRLPNVLAAFSPTPLRLSDLLAPMVSPVGASTAAALAVVALDGYTASIPAATRLCVGLVEYSAVYLLALGATPAGRSSLGRLVELLRGRASAAAPGGTL